MPYEQRTQALTLKLGAGLGFGSSSDYPGEWQESPSLWVGKVYRALLGIISSKFPKNQATAALAPWALPGLSC